MTQWMSRKVHVTLSIDLVLDMFLHAHQWDRERGGRYEGRYDHSGVVLLIWSEFVVSGEHRSGPQGEADFHWRSPFDGEVMLYRIGWDPFEGGSEEFVWEALEVLAGQPIRPEAL